MGDWRRSTTVAGLDLSLTNTGIAILNNDDVDVDADGTDGTNSAVFTTALIRSSGSKTDDVASRASRIDSITARVLDILVAHAVEFVVVESPSYGSTGGAAHERAGLWWAVVADLCRRGISVATVSPTGRAKYATGNGRSDKDVVLAAAIKRYDNQVTSGITNNNVADAVILAAMGARHVGCPVDDDLSQQHIAAMRGASWPTAIAPAG